MPAPAADDARRARNDVLAGLVASGGGRRAFVDATGRPVLLPPAVRRLVATDDELGAVLHGLGAPLVGCAGAVDGVAVVGPPRAPDPDRVAALRPDLIVTGAAERKPDLADPRLAGALRRLAPLVVVDLRRRAVAVAELRALLGRVAGGAPPATRPVSSERVGAPLPRRPAAGGPAG